MGGWLEVLGNGTGETGWLELLGEAAGVSGFGIVAVAQATRGKWKAEGEQRIEKPLRKSVVLHQKLEGEKQKGPSLDPQRNHHHHRHRQLQSVVLNSRYVEEGEEEEEEDQYTSSQEKEHHHHQQLEPAFLFQHQYLYQTQHHPQHLYGGLNSQSQPQPQPQQQPLQSPRKRTLFRPPAPPATCIEYARKMGESHHQATTSSRLGIRSAGGEIVEVQGGHIVRSTGRKDRHSKVCTAKGPRDRRVRLSAHTAIQFYDVQDRLGYDRPSKAVDWLIKKAKTAIDELAELPAWDPTTPIATTTAAVSLEQQHHHQPQVINENEIPIGIHCAAVDTISSGCRTATTMVGYGVGKVSETDMHNLQSPQMGANPSNSSSFLPPSLDSDSIADTIKSFFPTGAAAETAHSPPPLQFHNYPPDLLSRTSSQIQDLRLSLQSFNDPILLHQQQPQHQQNEPLLLFSGTTTQLGFDGSSAGWSDQHQHHQNHSAEISRFQRMLAWNVAGAETGGGNSGGGSGFMFNSPPPPPSFGQNQFFQQRGPLQSSNNVPSVRAWIDPSVAPAHRHQTTPTIQESSGIGFAYGGFPGFCIPARIQGDEEHDGISDKPSSASSDSRH